MANDPEVLRIWETTPALDGIPRFRGNGIFEGVEVSEEGSVTLTYFGVEDKDYLSYTNKLKSEGFSLEPDSAIWMAEGLSGYPLFQRGEVRVALVWSLNGVFTISVY